MVISTVPFKVGEVIWGKIRGWPHWPAKIIHIYPRQFEVIRMTGKFLIVKRTAAETKDWLQKVKNDVKFQPKVRSLDFNVVYATPVTDSRGYTNWHRCLLKHDSNDAPILSCMDVSKLVDYTSGVTDVRRVRDDILKSTIAGEIKLFIYAACMLFNEDMREHFQRIARKPATAIFRLMESTSNRIDTGYAGDILFTYDRNKVMSFR